LESLPQLQEALVFAVGVDMTFKAVALNLLILFFQERQLDLQAVPTHKTILTATQQRAFMRARVSSCQPSSDHRLLACQKQRQTNSSTLAQNQVLRCGELKSCAQFHGQKNFTESSVLVILISFCTYERSSREILIR
jgi:hypothetical protein